MQEQRLVESGQHFLISRLERLLFAYPTWNGLALNVPGKYFLTSGLERVLSAYPTWNSQALHSP